MTRTRRLLLAGAILLAGVALEGHPAEGAEEERVISHDIRIRSNHDGIRSLIAQATDQSPTFRALVEAINTSDGIVYVLSAECGHGVRACLTSVRAAGSRRIVTIGVDVRKADRDLMASIGHEVRHAIEVLSDRSVTSHASLYFFYVREGRRGTTGTFETNAAVEAGDAVKAEIREYRRRAQTK